MVRQVFFPLALLSLFLVSGCAMTEMPMAHENPLDSIYDSGNFRLVLTGEGKTATQTDLTWSNVYHRIDGAATEQTLALNPTASVYRSAAAPSAADIDNVKKGNPLSGSFTQIAATECPVKLTGTSYAGTCSVTSVPKGYFIIQFNYKYTGKTAPNSTGVIYSNFVVIQ